MGGSTSRPIHAISYVLPLRASVPLPDEAVGYVRWLSGVVDDVIVVDGSPGEVVDAHALAFGDVARVVRPAPRYRGRNGKVVNVLSGIDLARHDVVVIADDDVRYTERPLAEVLARVAAGADAVLPQNVYEPAPWHARWDTGRILVHRALGHDMGGTVVVRRHRLLGAGGYDADVLFENLELVRTLAASGARVEHARDVFVRRVPPSTGRFVEQRVRQAYDELARPWLLATWLAIAPAIGWRVARRRGAAWRELGAGAAAVLALAELGRRRDGGASVFPRAAAAWAVPWILERAVCAWLAVIARARGGIRYAGSTIRPAATPVSVLRRSSDACPSQEEVHAA